MKRFTGHTEPWGEFLDIKQWEEIKNPEKLRGKELFFGSVTDPYLPEEETYRRTRALLEQLQGTGIRISISTKSDLILRIQLEFSAAPARAYYDFQTLVKYFPAEKKRLQDIDAKIKANKEIGALGKIFEKILLWSQDDYVCKNKGEVNKNVQELKKYKKMLEALANSENAQLQGEAMLFQTQIDTLIDLMPTKVPQK